MATKRDDSLQFVSVRLDGKNYSYWSYVMKNFLRGKKMWGYVSGTYMIPKNIEEGDVVLVDTWKQIMQISLLGLIILLSIR